MASWSCFHLVKNAIPNHTIAPNNSSNHNHNIKLIHYSDGVVKIYHRPIIVSEVLVDFPKHLVCRSDSFYIGQKIPPLSDDDHLQLGHKYFLLPSSFFHSVLSFVTIASFFSHSNNNSNNKNKTRFVNNAAAACQTPFDIQRTPSGCLRIRVSDEFISKLLEQGTNPKTLHRPESPPLPLGKICTTQQLAKDYTQLVRTRQWKPKLETICESKKKGISHFGLKKAKPSGSHFKLPPLPSPSPPRNPDKSVWTKSAYRLHHLRSIQFAYKPKIRIKSWG